MYNVDHQRAFLLKPAPVEEEGILGGAYANASLVYFPLLRGVVPREPSFDDAPSLLDVLARTAAELVPRGSESSPSVGVSELITDGDCL